MKFSEHTLKVLKNFSQINDNILINPGNVLTTISGSENMVAFATIDEEFEQEVGIYSLSEFLSTLSLFENPTITFDGQQAVITEENGKNVVRYTLAAKKLLKYPKRKIQFPDPEFAIHISQKDLQKILKASNAMSLEDIVISVDNNGVVMRATDATNNSSNSFDITVDDWENLQDVDNVKVRIKADHLKIMPGDYRVEVVSLGAAKFVDNNQGLEYIVALEYENN